MAYWFVGFALLGLCFIRFLCWDVCWLLDAGFLAFIQINLRLLVPNVSFGMFVASTLASWGTLGRSWDTGPVGSRRKDTLRSRLWFLTILCRFRDPILKDVWAPLDQRCICSCLFPVCFRWWFLGLNLDVWDWKTKRLIFMSFVALETGLKLYEFPGWLRGLRPSGLGVSWVVPGP